MRSKKNLPAYKLWWKTGAKVGRYYTKRKKSFLFRLNGLTELKTLKKCWWIIEYNQKGDKNESVEYTDPKKALKDAKIFVQKNEVIQWL